MGENLAYISFSHQGMEHVIDTRAKILPLTSFQYNQKERVSKAAFSENDAYLITGNERGRSYVINPQEGTIQAELPPLSDVISAVAVSETYHLAASASFSRHLIVYKLNSFSTLFDQKINAIIEMMLFVDEQTLLAITRDGRLLSIDLRKGVVAKEVELDQRSGLLSWYFLTVKNSSTLAHVNRCFLQCMSKHWIFSTKSNYRMLGLLPYVELKIFYYGI